MPSLLILFGLTFMALLSYCVEEEYYASRQQAFVQGLSFEESMRLGLNAQQSKRLMEINATYYFEMQMAYGRIASGADIKNELQLLSTKRVEKISGLLTGKQLCAWRELQETK